MAIRIAACAGIFCCIFLALVWRVEKTRQEGSVWLRRTTIVMLAGLLTNVISMWANWPKALGQGVLAATAGLALLTWIIGLAARRHGG